jgi:hypothetical protein
MVMNVSQYVKLKMYQALPEAKVPSVVLYDAGSLPKAFGAETVDEDVLVQAEAQQWRKAER